MDNNDRANDDSLDSVPHSTYETLQEEEMCGNTNRTVEIVDNYNMSGEEERKAEDCDSDHDTDKIRHLRILVSQNLGNDETNDQDIHEDISLEYEEEEEELCEEYVQDGSVSRVEHVTADSKTDALIVQGNDGMIKKIKICNTTKDDNEKTVDKTKKLPSSSQVEGSNSKLLPRSSTPMSREYLALQRSVNESKILTEFVTDAASEKPRKLRAKDSTSSLTSSTADHSYSSTKKSSQSTPEKVNAEDIYSNISPNQGKRHYSKRYVPLKDSDYDVDLSSNLRPRSRSKSVHNSEFNSTGVSYKRLKRWPSEERLHKRTNMRSENTEFAQKQMEFLQRVIHACDLPQSRSRSRSCDRKTPTSLNDQSVVGSGGSSGNQRKNNKNGSKERHSRRSKCEMGSENDEQLLGENNSEHHDDEYGNESQTSTSNINTSLDTSLADNKEVEAHLKSVWQPSPKPGYDSFCWKCHENKVNLCCCKCIRSFHALCVKISKFDNIWLCPECTAVENLLNNPKRLRRNELSLDLLSQLLSFALKRMRYTKGHYKFVMPYEDSAIYKKYIAKPVTLSGLQSKIEAKEFRCAEEFVNETKWLLHNAYILSNRVNTKLVLTAKSIFKICRQEANEIETCAECYLNANTRTDWFVDVCSQPHLLLWAKLKGFPYWPAKAMGLGQNSLINVRFFGEHDRAFVPLKDCFLYSEQDPNTATGKRAARELADCIKEVEEHIEKIRSKIGGFKYAPFKTPYDPAEEIKQLAEMMPGVEDFIRKQQNTIIKPSLQFKIYKTADNNLSIVQKASTTPELSTNSLENDEREKKKKQIGECNESKKSDETTALPAKYEVISKVNSDESNTSKLGTVILKRKSITGDSKKATDDENIELPLPKMTKIEDQSKEDDFTRFSAKRKSESQPNEKLKAKHNKLELKVPIITIKTSLAKEPAEIHNKESQIHTSIASKATENHNLKQLPAAQENELPNASQKTVEIIVKHKQGVTIKKITKDSPNLICGEQITSTASRESQKESLKDEKESKEQSADEKARENLKVNNILKGLVPFVEVKQEVLTDNEDDAAKKMQNAKCPDKETSGQTINSNNESTKKIAEIPEANLQTVNNKDNNGNSNNTSEKNSPEKATEKEGDTEIVIQVKKEVLSDEDEIHDSINSSATVNQSTTKISQSNTTNNINNDEKQTANAIASDIRVVGDTTIQKLPNTNNKTQYIVYSTNSSNNNATGSSITAKRFSLKGVPYGPLPASAFPKVSTSKAFHQADMGLQPRAKKSFPNLSPPNEKSKANNNPNTLTQLSTPTTSQHLDQKRTMAKNTMVTIPVEVAVNRSSTNSGTIIIGSIPVPPLTAVSKTMPSSVAHNSTARNSPATITVSGSSGSLTTPSVLAQTKTTQSTALIASPITATTSPTLLAPLTSTSSLLSTPVSTTATLNPLTMTTPPPLAGLSNTNLITTSQTNGVSDHNITTAISSLPATQQPSTETHILGGLVTPTLASAITDVICRGPPKLAARPNGPLQSEGYPMFPSQAGPVCKRLVENAHKLTDFFISVVEDTMGEMAQGDDGSLQAKTTLLTIELERNKLAYEQEIAELKRTSDLMLCEMRKSMENEKTRLAVEIRKQCEMERLRSVEETKRKQWCANCFREANFYCCWNTSYCDYPCQQLHWSRHSHTCAQTRPALNETTNAATSQGERHHTNKTNSSTITLSSTANFNKSTPISQKKEKGIAKNSSNHMLSSSLTTSATPTASRPEVLKLPTNTYLRPVTSNLNSQTLRCNTTYSLPIQRFSSPMPITTPSNSSSPQTYTIVQQGNSWVMSSTTNNNGSNSSSNSILNSSTTAPPNASAAAQTRSTGTGTAIANKSAKTQIRYH